MKINYIKPKKKRERKVKTNIYKLFGVVRSGNHAITYWIFHMIKNKVLYANCCYAFENPFTTYVKEKNDFPKKITNTNKKKWLKQLKKHNNIFISYENFDIYHDDIFNIVDWDRIGCMNMFKRELNIVVIRDHFNVLSSILKLLGQRECEIKTKMELWKKYALAYINKKHNYFYVNYNSWCKNKKYRKSIANMLNLKFNDLGYFYVARNGGGSSFDKRRFNHKANEMKILERWEYYINDSFYKKYALDKECVDLSKKIFFDTINVNYITKCLKQ